VHRFTASAIALALLTPALHAQEAAAKPAMDGEKTVLEWLKRLNALADWDGKGDPKPLVDKFVDMYDPNILFFTGPNENQQGSVTYSGMEGLRHWADWFARTHSKSEYRIQAQTQKMKTATMVLSAEPPWGGNALAVEITAFYTIRQSQKKFAVPGAVFFVFAPEGRINRTHLYLVKDELVEIFP
jgi:hypothetical protein